MFATAVRLSSDLAQKFFKAERVAAEAPINKMEGKETLVLIRLKSR
jgi:hypothetical protein